MWSLIIKDLSLQNRNIWITAALATMVSLFFFYFTDGGEGIVYVFAGIAVMNINFRAAYEDDRNKGFSFLCSLPLKRSAVVWSKYAGSLIVLLAGFSAAFAIDLAFRGFAPESAYWQSLLGYSLLLPGMLVLLGIFWVLFFKFGYIRAVNIVRFLLLAPLAAVFVASAITTGGTGVSIAAIQNPVHIGTALALALLSYTIMLMASLLVFRNADLG